MSCHLKTHQIAQSDFEIERVNCFLEKGTATLVEMTFVRSTDWQCWHAGWQLVLVLIVV
jgi:hypothetical protein